MTNDGSRGRQVPIIFIVQGGVAACPRPCDCPAECLAKAAEPINPVSTLARIAGRDGGPDG